MPGSNSEEVGESLKSPVNLAGAIPALHPQPRPAAASESETVKNARSVSALGYLSGVMQRSAGRQSLPAEAGRKERTMKLPNEARKELYRLFDTVPGSFERVGAALVEGRMDMGWIWIRDNNCGCVLAHGYDKHLAGGPVPWGGEVNTPLSDWMMGTYPGDTPRAPTEGGKRCDALLAAMMDYWRHPRRPRGTPGGER